MFDYLTHKPPPVIHTQSHTIRHKYGGMCRCVSGVTTCQTPTVLLSLIPGGGNLLTLGVDRDITMTQFLKIMEDACTSLESSGVSRSDWGTPPAPVAPGPTSELRM